MLFKRENEYLSVIPKLKIVCLQMIAMNFFNDPKPIELKNKIM